MHAWRGVYIWDGVDRYRVCVTELARGILKRKYVHCSSICNQSQSYSKLASSYQRMDCRGKVVVSGVNMIALLHEYPHSIVCDALMLERHLDSNGRAGHIESYF